MLRPTTLALAALTMVPMPALAQDDRPVLRPTIQLTENVVAGGDVAAFDEWIAAFRASMEGVIAEGGLPLRDVCAYRAMRVLGPSATDRRRIERQTGDWDTREMSIYFLFDPLVEGAEYKLANLLEQALGAEEAADRMALFEDLVIEQVPVIVTDVNTEADRAPMPAECAG